jgi:hypothetical protein
MLISIIGYVDVKEYQCIVRGAIITAKVRLFHKESRCGIFPCFPAEKASYRRCRSAVWSWGACVITPTLSGKIVNVNDKFLIL